MCPPTPTLGTIHDHNSLSPGFGMRSISSVRVDDAARGCLPWTEATVALSTAMFSPKDIPYVSESTTEHVPMKGRALATTNFLRDHPSDTVVPYSNVTVLNLAASSGYSSIMLSALSRVCSDGRLRMDQAANGHVGGPRSGLPPLFSATTAAVVEMLVYYGADVNTVHNNTTALNMAVLDSNFPVVCSLLKHGACRISEGATIHFPFCQSSQAIQPAIRLEEHKRAPRWSTLRRAWCGAIAASQFVEPIQDNEPHKKRIKLLSAIITALEK